MHLTGPLRRLRFGEEMDCKMNSRISNEKAFTLIEVIVSLVLIGILSAIAGIGLIQITEGYVFSKKNVETAQKAQIAMTRIVKELGYATTITVAGTNSITFTRPVSATTSTTNIIDLSGTAVRIKIGAETATTLIDNVTAFTLDYPDYTGALLSKPVAATANIRQVDITLTVTGANNQSSTFNNRVTTLALQ
jgi:prepilin-type N-terminal cleavage/methylation domain-containing protein